MRIIQLSSNSYNYLSSNDIVFFFFYIFARIFKTKGMNPSKAMHIFEQMKKEDIKPTVVTFSTLISACDKGMFTVLTLHMVSIIQ